MSPLLIGGIIMAATFICFFIPKIPNVTVALGAALACAITGIVPLESAFSNFVSSTCILMISMMTIGGAMFQTGLGSWVGRRLIRLTGTKKGQTQILVFLITLLISPVLVGTAAMVMYPFMRSISNSAKLSMSDLVLYQTAGSFCGCWVTLTGAAMTCTSAAVLEASGYRSWDFFEIAWYGIPRLLLFIPLIYFFMNRFVIGDMPYKAPDEDSIWANDKEEARLTPKMITTLVILVLTIVGFVVKHPALPTHICAALGALACLVTGCLTPKDMLYKSVSWEVIILMGGMGTFAQGMQSSGFGQLLADSILKITGESAAPMLMVFLLIVITGILTQFMSDNAVVAMTTPIAILLAANQGIAPFAYAMACLVGSSLCHLSLMASPQLAFTMHIGGYEPKHLLKYALFIELPASLIAGMVMIPLVWL